MHPLLVFPFIGGVLATTPPLLVIEYVTGSIPPTWLFLSLAVAGILAGFSVALWKDGDQ